MHGATRIVELYVGPTFLQSPSDSTLAAWLPRVAQPNRTTLMIDQTELDALNASISQNLANVSKLGARVVVLSRFIAAAFPHVPASECAAIEQAFRHEINTAMSMTSDEPIPGTYESAMLQEVNVLIAALKQRGQTLQ